MDNDDNSPPTHDSPDAGQQPPEVAPAVALGQPMPDIDQVPTLLPQQQAAPPESDAAPLRHSRLAQGLSFTGSADIDGSITIAGEMQGDLRVAETTDGHVTITETGTLVGDIRARNISVLGQTVGTLDAAGGKVSLHSSASVSGHIRYSHLQVNGADLNAQLERVRTDGVNPPRG
ncbi:MAG TPA: polymer-forming cytoskeletal protein [Ideonella sp.]|nr:polymer-forming cytoskeletal protein [Ideonella sp.]